MRMGDSVLAHWLTMAGTGTDGDDALCFLVLLIRLEIQPQPIRSRKMTTTKPK